MPTLTLYLYLLLLARIRYFYKKRSRKCRSYNHSQTIGEWDAISALRSSLGASQQWWSWSWTLISDSCSWSSHKIGSWWAPPSAASALSPLISRSPIPTKDACRGCLRYPPAATYWSKAARFWTPLARRPRSCRCSWLLLWPTSSNKASIRPRQIDQWPCRGHREAHQGGLAQRRQGSSLRRLWLYPLTLTPISSHPLHPSSQKQHYQPASEANTTFGCWFNRECFIKEVSRRSLG